MFFGTQCIADSSAALMTTRKKKKTIWNHNYIKTKDENKSALASLQKNKHQLHKKRKYHPKQISQQLMNENHKQRIRVCYSKGLLFWKSTIPTNPKPNPKLTLTLTLIQLKS